MLAGTGKPDEELNCNGSGAQALTYYSAEQMAPEWDNNRDSFFSPSQVHSLVLKKLI